MKRVLLLVRVLLRAAVTTGVPIFSSREKRHFREIYDCGGGLLVASINAPHLLFCLFVCLFIGYCCCIICEQNRLLRILYVKLLLTSSLKRKRLQIGPAHSVSFHNQFGQLQSVCMTFYVDQGQKY